MKRGHNRARPRHALASFRRNLTNHRTPWPMWFLIACGILTVLLMALIGDSIRRRTALTAWRTSLEATAPATSWPQWDESWPPLPTPRNRTVRADLHGPYAFAARYAATLRYIPCYCGCRRQGHGSALNCFVQSFTARGTPIWTEHAFTCPLCVSIIREVSLLMSRGVPLDAIRRDIDEHHKTPFTTSTPTPMPMIGH